MLLRAKRQFLAFVLVALVMALGATGLARAQEASPAATDFSTFQVTGEVETPLTLTQADLAEFTPQTVDVTFMSGQGEQKHSYKGVLLSDVINKAVVKVNPDQKNDGLRKYLVVTANDGYEVVISWGEIDPNFGNSPYLLAWEEDGATLAGADGPVRLVTPGDVKGGRYVTGVVTIEVRDPDSAPRTS
jgi:DMSO/TMAO reductase YedYZ molybdopterin-dependent catalytic subunit